MKTLLDPRSGTELVLSGDRWAQRVRGARHLFRAPVAIGSDQVKARLTAGLRDQARSQSGDELRAGRIYGDCLQRGDDSQELLERGLISGEFEEARSAAVLRFMPVKMKLHHCLVHEGATLIAAGASWLAHGW